MKDITLNKAEFKLFNQDDQFGFFYDDDGFPRDDAEQTFDTDADRLYQQYELICIDQEDTIYGIKNGKKELIMENVIEAYDIAREVKYF